MLQHDRRLRYEQGLLTDVSSIYGRVQLIDGTWHIVLGNALFEVR